MALVRTEQWVSNVLCQAYFALLTVPRPNLECVLTTPIRMELIFPPSNGHVVHRPLFTPSSDNLVIYKLTFPLPNRHVQCYVNTGCF